MTQFSLADKLYANEAYTETVEVLGRKFEFRTLGTREERDIVRSAGNAENIVEILQARRIPTLARAIMSVDGVPWKDFDEIKQRLRSNPEMTLVQAVEQELSDPRYTDDVLQDVHEAYANFRQRYRNRLEELKKSSTPQNPAIVG